MITRENGSILVEHKASGETDTLHSFENLQFSDKTFKISEAGYAVDGAISLMANNADGISGTLADSQADSDAAAVAYSLVQGPEHGELVINSDGTYSYKATDGYTGTDTFTFKAVTTDGVANVGRMSVDVKATEVSSEYQASTNKSGQMDPDITVLKDGGYVVVWCDASSRDGYGNGVYGQRFDRHGNKAGQEFNLSSMDFNDQLWAKVTGLEDGGFVATWASYGNDGSNYSIQGQRFDSAGNLIGTQFQVNTTNKNQQQEPVTHSLADGGFVIVWQDYGNDGNGWGVYGQRYGTDGQKAGEEFKVNSYTKDGQYMPDVTSLADGGFVVSWTSNKEGTYNVVAQRYDAEGKVVGEEFMVNTYLASEDNYSKVTSMADGGFVVVWSNNGRDGNSYGVYGQRFDKDGKHVGDEFQANTHTNSSQNVPDVVGLADGGFVVAWQSHLIDGSDYGICIQRYDKDGANVGEETQVNEYTVSTQDKPELAALSDGGFVVVWESFIGGGQWQIRSRYYPATHALIDGTDGNDVITAGDYDDTLIGAAGHDFLDGGKGNDSIDGGLGADTINGGEGSDTVTYAASEEAVKVDLLAGEVSGGLAQGDTLTNVENIVGTDHNDTLMGDAAANELFGGKGDDTLAGGAGDDVLKGGEGNDVVVYVGAMADYLLIRDGDFITVEHVASGEKDILTGVESIQFSDTLFNIDGFAHATKDGISIRPGDADGIQGTLAGNNSTGVVYSLLQEPEHGVLTLNANGIYTYVPAAGYTGSDFFSFKAVNATGVVSTGSMTVDVKAATETEAVTVEGGEGNDVLMAGDFNDTLKGLGGNDYLEGGKGDDFLDGGLGGDKLQGGEGTDTVTYKASDDGVQVDLFTGAATGGYAAGDTFVDVENVIGSQFSDAIIGNDGANLLDGLSGDDTLLGGLGSDTLHGGQGMDTAVFRHIIADYAVVRDGEVVTVEHKISGDKDTLTGIEFLEFADTTVAVAEFGYAFDGNIILQRGDADGVTGSLAAPDTMGISYELVSGPVHGVVDVKSDGSFSFVSANDYVGQDSFSYKAVDANGITTFANMVVDIRHDHVGEYEVNTHRPGPQEEASITTLVDGGFVIVWQDASGQDGSGYGVYGQRYDSRGGKLGEEFALHSITASDQAHPHVTALAGGGFVAVWGSCAVDGSGYGICAQRFDASGNKVGEEFQVNTYTAGEQNYPCVAGLEDGGFVIAWDERNGLDGSNSGVYAQRYDAEGNKVGDNFNVPDHLGDSQEKSKIIGLSDGGFVVVWQSAHDQDGSGWGTYMKRYDVNGDAVGTSVKVNEYWSSYQYQPAVTELNNGGVVVTWTSNRSGSNGEGIFGKRYDKDGNPQGGEFQVNTYNNSTQWQSEVTALTDGGFVAVWASYVQDGSGYGVYGQRFNAAGDKAGTEFQVNSHVGDRQCLPVVTPLDNGGFVVAWQSIDGSDEIRMRLFTGSNQVMEGSIGNDFISGGDGNDTLSAGAGFDKLEGGLGDDNMSGGAGADVLDGGEGIDMASYVGSDAAVNIDLAAGTTEGGHAKGDILINIENLTGSDHDDVLMGNAAGNTLDGGKGDDTLFGGGGCNSLVGGDGLDVVRFSGAVSNYSVTLTEGVFTVQNKNTGTVDTLSSVEVLEFIDTTVHVDDLVAAGEGRVTLVEGEAPLAGTLADEKSASVKYEVITGPVHGVLVLNEDGSYTFQADEGFSGTDIFTYKAVDANGIITTGTIAVDVFASQNGVEYAANSYIPGTQRRVSVSGLKNGGYVTAWHDESGHDGSNIGVFGQLYDKHGAKVGTEFQLNTQDNNSQNHPSVACLEDGGFITTWALGRAAGHLNVIAAQRFDAQGNKVGSEFEVCDERGDCLEPSVSGLSGGGFVITWYNSTVDGDSNGIVARCYDSNGTPVSDAYIVNTYTYSAQNQPKVTSLSHGGYVITWASNTQDGSCYGIYCKEFDASGNAMTGDIRVNSYIAGDQHVPDVCAMGDGSYVIVWQDAGKDGSSNGIYGQRFGANGIKLGSEFSVNTYITSSQSEASISALPDGGFIVTWNSNGPDGSGYGIYGQRFDADGNKLGTEFRINDNVSGDQLYSEVSVLKDGSIVVAWESADNGTWDIKSKLLAASNRHLAGTENNDVLAGFAGSDTLVGLGGRDNLVGGAGNDSLDGGNGSDTLIGGTGKDVMDGGQGTDTAVFAGEKADYEVVFGETATTVKHIDTGDIDTLVNVEYLQFDDQTVEVTTTIDVSDPEESPYGTEVADILQGTDATDRLFGRGGGDIFYGKDGNDWLYGQKGDDTIHAGAGADRVFGHDDNDELHGDDGDDMLYGGLGDDFIDGGSGDDSIIGGLGADTLDGSSGNDTITYTSSSSGISLDLGTGFGSAGDAEGDVVSNVENVFGSYFGDTISGSAADEHLSGLSGDDVLTGGEGTDFLNGGAGNDTYLFSSGDGADDIQDSSGNDKIIFGEGLTEGELWFSQEDNNLTIGVIGTEDKLTVSDWYAGDENRIEEFTLSDGSILMAGQVQSLVDAMSAYTPTGAGVLTVPNEIQDDVQNIIATNWQKS
ncbi:Ig-like domain-containing protein [Salidesulfovibrio onnuriiensis]|uniref:Ig-like domain-containing protein n=1 Tax=Salidesulfovibrio onnuriiensis TaxID=2583823 RepID=UPI00164FDBCB|nr:Ig-like domain-containing protein [Salidesulfovibrio onnuriiensis]